MDTKTGNRQQGKPVEGSIIAGTEAFNFDLWASEVKRQMIASLQKRTSNWHFSRYTDLVSGEKSQRLKKAYF